MNFNKRIQLNAEDSIAPLVINNQNQTDEKTAATLSMLRNNTKIMQNQKSAGVLPLFNRTEQGTPEPAPMKLRIMKVQ